MEACEDLRAFLTLIGLWAFMTLPLSDEPQFSKRADIPESDIGNCFSQSLNCANPIHLNTSVLGPPVLVSRIKVGLGVDQKVQ
jgi:hypothetical protein